jgi:hypothetical protein
MIIRPLAFLTVSERKLDAPLGSSGPFFGKRYSRGPIVTLSTAEPWGSLRDSWDAESYISLMVHCNTY